MKYAKHLKCLYYIGKISKYLYFAKKTLCISAVVIAALLGIGLLTGGKCKCKALKGLM